MKVEKSCGAVIYTEVDGKRKYVIISNLEGVYGFPKGHMEAGETEEETALREIKEEVGLDVTLIEGFKTKADHTFFRGEEEILKKVVYFVATYKDQEFKRQEEELSNVELMDYETAMNSFQFENCCRVLTEVEEFLNKNKK